VHPTIEQTRRFFDAIARRYDRAYAPDRDATRARMQSLLARLPPGARVLDLGIGTGRELPFLLDAGFGVTGIELSPRMVELCRQRRRKVPIVSGDFYDPLPFADDAFDCAIALFGTLSHPPDEQAHARLARELRRVVKQLVVFEVPSPHWARNQRALLHRDRSDSIAIIVPTEDEWRRAFAPHFSLEIERPNPFELVIVAR
jgi:SAM-dependent methyltransferase